MNTPSSAEPEIIERQKFLVMGTQARFKLGAESGDEFRGHLAPLRSEPRADQNAQHGSQVLRSQLFCRRRRRL